MIADLALILFLSVCPFFFNKKEVTILIHHRSISGILDRLIIGFVLCENKEYISPRISDEEE